jgi:hypothetical protein
MMKMRWLDRRLLDIFDRYFVHIFISSLHIFFISLAAWLDRADLVLLGVVVFPLSFASFELVAMGNSRSQ